MLTSTIQKPISKEIESTKISSFVMNGCRTKNKALENSGSLKEEQYLQNSENKSSSSSNDTNTSLGNPHRNGGTISASCERNVNGDSSLEPDSNDNAEANLIQSDSKR